jgi:hypothetical protein
MPNMTVQVSRNKEEAITSLLDRSYLWFAPSFTLALVTGFMVQPSVWATVIACSLALVFGGCALYLLRHYNFWYSWLWWLPLLPAFFVIKEPMRTGELSIALVAHAVALGSSLMFGAFWYFRKSLRRWAC